MGAVPKTKVSRARRDKRRANSFRLKMPGIGECPRCHEVKRLHRACPSCGYYDGREVIKIDASK